MTTICPKLPTWSKRGIFRKFKSNDFYLLIVPYDAANFEKNSQHRSLGRSFYNFGPQVDQNCPFSSKENFFGKFQSTEFHLLIVPYHTATYGPELDQNCPFGPKKGFFYVYLLWPTMLQSLRRIFSTDPKR